jgi:hypothetical protein
MATMHNPLVFNSLENAGYNAANRVWEGAELVAHYGTPFIAYGAYKGLSMGLSVVRWAFSTPVAPAPVSVPEPRSWLSSVASIVWWKVAIPAAVIAAWQWLHDKCLREGFWQNYKGLGVAFLRPLMEKIMPSLYGIFDGGDWNFNLRDFVPGGEGTVLTRGVKPIYMVRGLLNYCFSDCSTASCGLENRAYALGESVANTLVMSLTLARDVIWGTSQIGPCMNSSRTRQCLQDATNYLDTQFGAIYKEAGPIHEALSACKDAAYDWGKLALGACIAAPKYLVQQGLHYGDQILRQVAIAVEEQYQIPQFITYPVLATVGTASVSAVGLYTAYKTAKFVHDYMIPEAARYYARSLWEAVPSLRIMQ